MNYTNIILLYHSVVCRFYLSMIQLNNSAYKPANVNNLII